MGRTHDRIDDETSNILAGIEDEDDPRVGYAAARRRIEALRKNGRPVPEALLTAERLLSIECMAASQGR